MLPTPSDDADETQSLLGKAARGDQSAIRKLLAPHRGRLRRMVALRLDSGVAARVDASDIVQEAFMDAARKLADYERDRPLPFYPWLHRLASERLAAAHRKHRTGNRDVAREHKGFAWNEDSAPLLIDRLVAQEDTPAQRLIAEERRKRVREALELLAPADREILVMRYLEDLSFPEISAILEIGESAAKMRHLRAIERIRAVLEPDDSRSGS